MGDFVAAVEAFLRKQFPQFEVLRAGAVIELQSGGLHYSVRVMPDAVAPGADVEAYLGSLNIEEEICRAEGMPLVLGVHGIRLQSSN